MLKRSVNSAVNCPNGLAPTSGGRYYSSTLKGVSLWRTHRAFLRTCALGHLEQHLDDPTMLDEEHFS
jgi:hypothetical protein